MRILLVEDDLEISTFVKAGLESEYFIVDAVADGEAGSYAARTAGYDLIVLDNVLPKKTGGTVCKEIREAGKTTPILMLSVKADVNSKVDLLNAGADDYLAKPFSFAELIARIRALLRRPGAIEGAQLMIDDLMLDTATCKVTRGQKEVYLTRKEFMLLEYFLKNQGIVLSRGMILEHVWDMNADPFSNTIESHILSVRKKIEGRGKRKLIHTVPGRGYKIDTAGR